MEIRIGTSGFSYDDWKGPFYPPDLPRSGMLQHYCRVFDTVEINSTYYRIPPASTFASMLRRVPERFLFAVKVAGELTHHETDAHSATWSTFRDCLEPLRESGQLGAVLAQFPHSFLPDREARDRLSRLREALPDDPLVVEFRNIAWRKPSVLDWLRSREIGVCCVDEPDLEGLMPPSSDATSRVGYVRFHGRNAEKWWRHEQAFERYDYLYSSLELEEWTPRIRSLAATTERTFVFFNNHYLGSAARNAQDMARLLDLMLPPGIPEQGLLDL